MGIDGSTLFSGYAGVTKSINEDADFLKKMSAHKN